MAEKIRLKWADPAYRSAVEEGIRSSNKTLSYLRVRDPNAPIRRRTKREKNDDAARLAKKMAKAEKDREKRRQKIFKAAKKAIRDKPKQSIKELLGSEIWFEEKVSTNLRTYSSEMTKNPRVCVYIR